MAIENDDDITCVLCQTVNDPGSEVCSACGVMLAEDPEVDALDAEPGDDPEPRFGTFPKDGLLRQAPFEVASTDGLTFEGYAAVFDDPTIIDSWEGRFRETIQRGAFAKTLSERTPVMMFDHGQHPMIGMMPIGSITRATEDDHGVHIEARLLDNWLISPVRDAIDAKAIDGMSFRMNVIKDDWQLGDDKIPERTIREVSCPELGPVVFPAYTSTTASVRSRELATSLADPEVRADLARLLLSGTPEVLGAATPTAEPLKHSVSTTQLRRRAQALLRNV